jgi:uncharacterized membrane protein YgcG
MADFCRQCSIEEFGQDFGDLAGLVSPGSAGRVICEGCGITYVNHLGECVAENCLLAHGLRPKTKETPMLWFKHKHTGEIAMHANAPGSYWEPYEPPVLPDPPADRDDDDADDDSSTLSGIETATSAVEALESIESAPDTSTPDFSGGGGDSGGGGASDTW